MWLARLQQNLHVSTTTSVLHPQRKGISFAAIAPHHPANSVNAIGIGSRLPLEGNPTSPRRHLEWHPAQRWALVICFRFFTGHNKLRGALVSLPLTTSSSNCNYFFHPITSINSDDSGPCQTNRQVPLPSLLLRVFGGSLGEVWHQNDPQIRWIGFQEPWQIIVARCSHRWQSWLGSSQMPSTP